MNANFDSNKFIQRCTKLSNLFEMLHGGQVNQIQNEEDLELDITLPFLVLNAKEFRHIFAKIRSKPSFRVSAMISVFQSDLERIDDSQSPPQNIDSLPDGQKLAYLKRDLERQTNGEKVELFHFHAYARYLADVFPILYNRFKSEFPFKTFINVLKDMSEHAILSTCFAFPHFITPLFRILPDPFLKTFLAVLSPQLRPILLPQLNIEPKTLSILYVHYFGNNSSSLLLQKFGCNFMPLREAIDQLLKINCNTRAYFLCIARMCACIRTITETEIKVMLKCTDSKLLCSLFFYLHLFPSNYINVVIDHMCSKKEYFIDLMLFFSTLYFNNTDQVAQWISSNLGQSFTSVSKGTFYHEITTKANIADNVFKYCVGHPKSLMMIGSTIIQATSLDLQIQIAKAIECLEEVTPSDMESINKFMLSYAQSDRLPDIIAEIVSDKPFFDVQKIRENAAPATAACIMVMLLNSPRRKSLLQHIPVRLILSACHKYLVFFAFCEILRQCFPFSADEEFLSLTMDDIKVSRHPREVLEDLKLHKDDISDELFYEWRISHFISSFDFVLATLLNLGAPMRLSNLQFLFSLPDSVLHQKNSFKIALTCCLDVIQADENVEEMAVIVLLIDAIEKLADSRIDRESLGWFISHLIRSPKRFITVLNKEFPIALTKEFAKNVKLTDQLATELFNGVNTFSLIRFPTILSLMIAYSHTRNAKIGAAVISACSRIEMHKDGVILDKVDAQWTVTVSKLLCELASIYIKAHLNVQHLVGWLQDQFASQLSRSQIGEMNDALNKLTASLFTIDI